MKYKVGDKVRVKSREWYEANRDEDGDVKCTSTYFIGEMSMFCGRTAIVNSVESDYYNLDDGCWKWTDEMLEDEAEDVNNINIPESKTIENPIISGLKTPEEKIQCDYNALDKYNGNEDDILSEALTILNGDRQADYGDAVENFKNIAKCASDWCGKELTALDCVNVMIAVKTKREQFKHKRDNLVDLAAYMEIRRQIIENNEN